MKYKSCAQWNSAETGIEYSEDFHASPEAAESVCRMLKRQGFGGQGKFFPVRTWTEPFAEFDYEKS